MRNIIVIAYQLHFSKGSECSIAWEYINHVSKRNKITVLYGTSGSFHSVGDTKAMEEWCNENNLQNVTFIPVHPSTPTKNYGFSLIGQYLFYKEYRKWHEDAARVVSELMKREKYDIIHYHGPTGYREPGILYNYPLPYVWGPTGGFGGANPRLLKASGSIPGALHMFAKRLLNDIQAFTDHRVKKALKESDVVICCSSETEKYVNRIVGKKHHSVLLYRSENCMQSVSNLNLSKFEEDKIHFMFSGTIDNRKGLIFILEALNKLPKNDRIVLDILGDGPLRNKLEKWADCHDIKNNVVWHGMLPREQVFDLVDNSQLMIISSLHDATTTVLWEAMSMCVPVMTLDHKGMKDVIRESSGYKIKPHSYKQIVNDMSKIFKDILDNPTVLYEKANRLLDDRKPYTWEKRELFYEDVFDLAEKQFKKRVNK